jgi:hypothetical protein
MPHLSHVPRKPEPGQSRGSLSHSEDKISLAVWAFLGVGCDGSFRAVRRAARDGPMGCARAPLLA